MLAAGLLAAGIPLPAIAAAPAAPPAATIVSAGGPPLQELLDAAAPGAVLRLQPGVYGPVRITRPLTLEGEPGAELRGPGTGSTVTILAPDVTVRGLTVRGSGSDIEAMDSGVFVGKEGDRALVEGNRIEGNLFGVYLWGPKDAMVRGNEIIGRREDTRSEAGNGVSVWNSPGSKVVENDFRFGRDGIWVITSKQNVFSGNRMRDLRFAVHYMYTNDSEVSDNVSTGNHVGLAIMFSNRLKILRNLSEGDRDHGMLFNYANHSTVEGNIVRDGGEKCVFIYNANFNRFLGNWFEGCEIGIHFTAGSERNEISGNAFINNRNQVKYVGTRSLDWSSKGRGNYWSDNPAFDLNGDGIADTAYRPNDIIDQVLWTAPAAKLLVNSPAVQVIRWAQSQFPALHPGGVIDSAPLMRPPEVAPPPAAHARS